MGLREFSSSSWIRTPGSLQLLAYTYVMCREFASKMSKVNVVGLRCYECQSTYGESTDQGSPKALGIERHVDVAAVLALHLNAAADSLQTNI